ncbi:MAG: energy transducer TonB [Burkholderiales bacterium]|nr:energy transducer TonB [Burkholderiales bacterium]
MKAKTRNTLVGSVVLMAHAGVLVALVAGAHPRPDEVIIPAMVVAESVDLAVPAPTPEAPEPKPRPVPRVEKREPAPREPAPSPLPAAAPSTEPLPAAPAAAPESAPPSPARREVAAAPAAPPAPPRVELPSASAAYLDNPPPEYPRLSRRLGEQGRVVLRVLIGVDGSAAQAEIRASSGFERLDQAALRAVLRWKYVPGRRGGTPEAMWFNVPVHFVLE